MPSQAWPDERLDEQAAKVQALAEEVAKIGPAVDNLTAEARALRQTLTEESRSLREAMAQDSRTLRSDFSNLQQQITRIGWALAIAVMIAVIGAVLAAAFA